MGTDVFVVECFAECLKKVSNAVKAGIELHKKVCNEFKAACTNNWEKFGTANLTCKNFYWFFVLFFLPAVLRLIPPMTIKRPARTVSTRAT